MEIEIHIGVVPRDDARVNAADLFVDDADALVAVWTSSGVEAHPPQDTQWGQREDAGVYRDANLIRFGSPRG